MVSHWLMKGDFAVGPIVTRPACAGRRRNGRLSHRLPAAAEPHSQIVCHS